MKCPTPHKTAYPTRKDAAYHSARQFREGASPIRMRVYHCRCHAWHLTKQGPLEAEIAALMQQVDGT